MCGSAQQAIHFVAQEIASGDMEVGVACGVEMMSVEKMGSDIPVPAFMKLLTDFPFRLVPQVSGPIVFIFSFIVCTGKFIQILVCIIISKPYTVSICRFIRECPQRKWQ